MNAFLMNQPSSERNVNYPPTDYINKPIIIYYFIDPFCETCWDIEPILKKITMEYGAFCSIRPVVGHSSSQTKIKHINDVFTSKGKYTILLAMKAAALQGNKTGRDYLRHIQDYLFLYNDNTDVDAIIHKACNNTNIDTHEFERDLYSVSAKKAYESDQKLVEEMEVQHFPALVFLSQHIEDYSMKVSGVHHYDTYTYILEKMLEEEVMNKCNPTLDDFFHLYKRFKTEDFAFVFEITVKEAKKHLAQLQLMQKIQKIQRQHKHFWEVMEQARD